MQNQNPFSVQALTLPISVSTTASSSTALPAVGNCIRLINEGSVAVFVSVGTGAQVATLPNATATATSTPVMPGTDITLSLPGPYTTSTSNLAAQSSALNISAICRSGTAVLDVQVGEGV